MPPALLTAPFVVAGMQNSATTCARAESGAQ
jgi:hypothetical protein